MISVLSGGVGAARLLAALRANVPDVELEAIVNVGDDLVLNGLTICPDLDTITYTLAGLNNEVTGWGLTGETWRVMDELVALGGQAWFRLGDRDLATHLYRTQRLAEGATKSEVAAELADRHGVDVRLLPVSDDPLATMLNTEVGELSFQEYFVAHRHDVAVHAIHVEGATSATATRQVLASLERATRIVIAPSNPFLSIEPILTVAPVRERLASRRHDVIAVSPIVGGAAIKGPADRLLAQMGYPATCVGVAQYYRGLVGTLVIDEVDATHADAVRDVGMDCIVTTTVMENPANAARLALVVTS
ncbi:MAG: 2-phospho-L-lactate transferase [Acidimicrobiales bacterium]